MKYTLKIVMVIFFLGFYGSFSWAQNSKVDSMDVLIQNATSDTGRINLVLQKIDFITPVNLDSAIGLALRTLKDATQIKYYQGEVDVRQKLVYNYSYKGNFNAAIEQLNYLERFVKPTNDSSDFATIYASRGLLNGMQSKYDSSIYFYEKAILIYERTGNRERLSVSYSNMAIGYQQQSNFPMALLYQQKSLKLYEEDENESGQAYTYVNMANTYINLGDAPRAENTFLKSIELAKRTQLKNVELYAYNNLSDLHREEENWQKSYTYALKSADLAGEMGDQGIQASSLSKASLTAVQLGQIENARGLAEKAILLADSSGQPYNINQAYGSMGTVLKSQNKWKEAIPFFEKAIESLEGADIYTQGIGKIYGELSGCYEKTGQYSKALQMHKQYSEIADSVRNRENIQEATELTMNYEFEKKEQATKAKQEAKDEISRTRQLALIIGLVLSLIIIAVAFYAYYNKQKANTLLRAQKREVENTFKKLKNTQAQLIHAEKMASLGELTAGIAHEIQNPLNFVNNFSEVAVDMMDELNDEMNSGNEVEVKAITEDIKQNLQKINHHGQRAAAIVKGMLEHSRSNTGEKESVDINMLADEYLRLAYHGLRAKDKNFNADFKTDLDQNLPQIKMVPQDIGRVLLNLINNAFYAVNQKARNHDLKGDDAYKPLVTVSTILTNGMLEIKIADNGNGIPDKVRDKIFQPFFTTKPTGEGTGLGLSLSYDIITKGHGGTMKVISEEGVGSEFMIQLSV